MPVVGNRAALQWLAAQPPYSAIDSRFAEAARSGDLGYTWGSYVDWPGAKADAEGVLRPRLAARAKRPMERRDGRAAAAIRLKPDSHDAIESGFCKTQQISRQRGRQHTWPSAQNPPSRRIGRTSSRREHNRELRSRLRTALKAIRAVARFEGSRGRQGGAERDGVDRRQDGDERHHPPQHRRPLQVAPRRADVEVSVRRHP